MSVKMAAAMGAIMLLAAAPAMATKEGKLTDRSPDKSEQVTDEATDALLVGDVLYATMVAVSTGDRGWAREILDEAEKDAVFAGWRPLEQYSVYYLRAQIEMAERDFKKADTYLAKAAAIAPEARDAGYWRLLAGVSGGLGKMEAAVDAYTLYVESRPVDLNEVAGPNIMGLVDIAGSFKDEGVRQRRLLEALRAAEYVSPDPIFPTELIWFSLFEIYAEEGSDEKAAALLPFVWLDHIQMVRTDHRFRRFAEAHPEYFDYETAIEADLVRKTTEVGERPQNLMRVYSLANALYMAGRLDEALGVVETIVEKAGEDAYEDEVGLLPWVYDLKGGIMRLRPDGRADAEAAYIMARDMAQATRQDEVSSGLNLANYYVGEGKPEAALAALKSVPQTMSPYGKMVQEGVRACAYAQLGQKGKLKTALRYLRKNAREGFRVTVHALACAGEEDELARLLIDSLEDKNLRTQVLHYVQTYLPHPYVTPVGMQIQAVRQRVLDREDVRKAIETYGVIETIPYFYR